MEENLEEGKPTNPEEAETSAETTAEEGLETSEEPGTPEEELVPKAQVDRLYARLKKQEEKAKALSEELGKMRSKQIPRGFEDVERVAEVTSALQGLDSRERAHLIEMAKAKSISLGEARSHEDFTLWRSAYRAEQKKKQALEPSTKQGIAPRVDPIKAARKLKEGMISVEEWNSIKNDPEKRKQFLMAAGVIADYSRYNNRQIPGVKRTTPSRMGRRLPYKRVTGVGKSE